MRGLGSKLVVLVLLAGALPLVVAGALAVVDARETAETAIREGNRGIALRAASEIGAVIEHARDLLRAAAGNRVRAELTPAAEQRVLISLKLQFPVLASITRVDLGGVPRAWTDAVTPAPLAADDPALASARAGTAYASDITTGDDLVPRMRIALPLREAGRPAGAIIAILDLAETWRIVDEIHVGATGRVLLLDDGGAVIAHGDTRGKSLLVREQPLLELAAAARAAREPGALVEGIGSLGQRALSVVVPVPNTTWILVLEQDVGEAFARVSQLSWRLAALGLVSLLLATVAAIAFARRQVLRPVRRLEEAALAYGQERFDHRVVVASGDELERLAGAMNEMAARVAAARQELERSAHARALGLLAGGLLHDLKHPVAAFQALFLRADRLGSELDARLAETARREVPKLTAIVDELQELGRARQRRDSEFGAEALVESLDSFRARAEERGVGLVVTVPEPPPRLRADRHMLSRAVTNLVANAVDASPDGGKVRIAVAAEGTELIVTVDDEGPGLADAAQPFEDFRTSKPDGLGLGLTVVKQVVDAHGGQVSAGRNAGGGARFTLRLPVVA